MIILTHNQFAVINFKIKICLMSRINKLDRDFCIGGFYHLLAP